MSKEYIERGALEEKLDRRLKKLRKKYGYFDHYTDGFDEAVDIVSDEPAADVVEVVRCKDCKHYDTYGCKICTLHSVMPDEYGSGANFYTDADDYCSYGERKEQANA